MASTLVKLVASNLLRARPVASSSRFLNTKAFHYVQHDSEDECILKRDEKSFTVAQAAINHAFSPRVSPVGNLARLLNTSDELIGFLHWPTKFPRWTAVEDDKALYILRNTTGSDNNRKLFDPKESVPNGELMSAIHQNDVKESVPKSEIMSEIHEKDVNESFSDMAYVRLWDLGPYIDLARGLNSEFGAYYFHVTHGGEAIDDPADSIRGTGTGKGGLRISANLRVCSVLKYPKAVYIVVGVEAEDTSGVYGGYVYEIFVDDSLYNIMCVKMDLTSEIWKITIPKRKGGRTRTISGNLIFFREEKVCEPTLWQPKLDHVTVAKYYSGGSG